MSPSSSSPERRRLSVVVAAVCLLGAGDAAARELYLSPDGQDTLNLSSALKSAVLLSEPSSGQSGASGVNFWRARSTLDANFDSWFSASVAYEQRVLASSSGTGFGDALLPPSNLPYRVQSLGSSFADEPDLSWTQALDRALLSVQGEWGRATLGRQAIGFGRSTFFSVSDVLAPFGTFQIDQEWKSGVDAFDIEWQLSPSWSVGLSEAAERDFSDGALLGRTSLNLGDADVLLLGGRRSQDWMAALASSAALLDAEVHGELGVFFTDGAGVAEPQLGDDTVLKGVVGASYNFDVLFGLMVLGEYHFNGFGLSDIPSQQLRLADAGYVARFQRGDFQTLGRHEFALSGNLVINEVLRGYGYSIVSGQDASGLGALGLTIDASDGFSLDVSGFFPWGKAPRDGSPLLRSEYGAAPMTAYVSMRFYD